MSIQSCGRALYHVLVIRRCSDWTFVVVVVVMYWLDRWLIAESRSYRQNSSGQRLTNPWFKVDRQLLYPSNRCSIIRTIPLQRKRQRSLSFIEADRSKLKPTDPLGLRLRLTYINHPTCKSWQLHIMQAGHVVSYLPRQKAVILVTGYNCTNIGQWSSRVMAQVLKLQVHMWDIRAPVACIRF